MKPLLIITCAFLIACKSEKKENKQNNTETKVNFVSVKKNKLEEKLVDVRNVDKAFNFELKVESFGVEKVNDSIFNFVFKIDPTTKKETVSQYSYGIRGFSPDSEKPYLRTNSPDITIVDNSKYIILRNMLKEIRYFDSLDVYIYKRKDWKSSGRLGSIKIYDILLEEK